MNNISPLVSVIVPVYNHEKFIGETIQKVISQTYQNWEMLVVNDCSTDGSWKIIKELARKDDRIRTFKNKKNRGLVLNWKFLINNSRGEFVAFLEGDDFFYRNNLRKKMKIFEEYPDVGMVYCNFNVVNEKGEVITKNHNKFQHIKTYRNESIEPSEYLYSKYHLVNSYGQVMVRKCIFDKIGYPRTLDYTEKVFLPSDWDFNFRVSTQNKIYFTDDILFAYRRHSNNCSYNAAKAYRHISLVLDEYADKFKNDSGIIAAIHYKRRRYMYSKIIYYLEQGKKLKAWQEFFVYISKFNGYRIKDFDLNMKLFVRLFLPNRINLYIMKKYYHK